MALTQAAADKAAATHQQYSTDMERIRTNGNLSADARRKSTAQIYTKAKATLDGLSTISANDQAAQRRSLMQQVFGLGDLTSSGLNQADLAQNYRDAQDRAALIDTETEANAALEKAEDSDDALLARAIAWQAWQVWPQWASTVNAYLASRPAAATALGQLQEINDNAPTDPLKDALRVAGELYLPVPQELTGLQLYEIQAIAADSTAA